jgi:hypothetical protein
VMPNGYGTYHDGRSVAREQRILEKNSAPNGPLDISRAAEDPVLRLAADKGVKLTLPQLPASTEPQESKSHRTLAWITAAAFSLVAAAAFAFTWIHGRRRKSADEGA